MIINIKYYLILGFYHHNIAIQIFNENLQYNILYYDAHGKGGMIVMRR